MQLCVELAQLKIFPAKMGLEPMTCEIMMHFALLVIKDVNIWELDKCKLSFAPHATPFSKCFTQKEENKNNY